jgi:hypothetical protein
MEMLRNWNKDIGVSFCKYEPDQGEVNAIFTTTRLPGMGGEAEKDDTINNQLADLNRKVCQDSAKIKNMPNKMQTFWTFLDNPNLDGEQDHLRTRAEKVKYEVKIPEISLKEINNQFEREGKRSMNDIKGEITLKDGSREFLFDYAEIDSG